MARQQGSTLSVLPEPVVTRTASSTFRYRTQQPKTAITGLAFDLCGVFYDNTIWRRWLLQLVSRLGLHTNYALFFRVWERDYLCHVNRGQWEYWEAMRAFLLSAGLSRGQVDEVEAAGHARRRMLKASIRAFPGIHRTLDNLADRGIALGLISHAPWTTAQLQEKLERLGLAGYFRTVISPLDLQFEPTSCEPYRRVAAELQLPTAEVAYVGHDREALVAAAQAGLHVWAINQPPQAPADVYLDTFTELLEMVPERCYYAA